MEAFNKIQQNIHDFIKKYFLNELFKGMILFVVFSFLYLIITALIEYFFWLPPSGRKYLYYAQWVVLGLFFILFILRPLLNLLGIRKEISDEKAARIIGDFFPEIKDKLLNTLQLHQQSADSALLMASIEQKSRELNRFSFSKAVDFKKNYKYLPLLLIPLLIFGVLRLTHFDKELSKGYERVLSYSENFMPPLPYSVQLPDSLKVITGNDYKLLVKLKGNELPRRLYIQIDDEKIPLKKETDSLFSFYFPLVQQPVDFSLSDDKYPLGNYRLDIIHPPVVQQLRIKVSYPSYLHKAPKEYTYAANITVPQSSVIHWNFQTAHTDSIEFTIDNKTRMFPVNEGKFSYNKTADTDFSYAYKLKNKHLDINNTNPYKVEVIKDEFPQINVQEKKDTINRQNFYRITASDDYALTRMQLVYTNRKTGQSSVVPISIPKSDLVTTHFIYPGEIPLKEGASYEYYFKVFDNDAVHKFKSVKSKTFYYNNLSEEQLKELNLKQQQQNLNQLDKFQQQFTKQQENLNKIQSKIASQKSMDWQSKKQLENTIQQAEQQEEFFKQAVKKYKDLLEKLPEDEKNRDKEELKKRLEELAKMEKKKKMLDELKKLAEQLKKEDLVEKLKDLKKYSEHQEKSLERILELTKKYYMQQKMKKMAEQLDELSKKQEELAKQNNDTSAQQDSLNNHLSDMKKQMDSLQKMNEELKKPMQMPDAGTEMQEIQQDMQKASEQLQNQQNSPANKSQQKAANKMKQLSQNMMNMMMGGGGEQQQEDIKTLQALLKSLLNFSFKEENLLTDLYAHKGKQYLSQQLLSQNQLKQYFKHINDSLYTLALRNPKISQQILDEAFEIESNLDKSLSYLSENQIYNTQNSAQYILKGANTLADFLSTALDQMKNSMQAMGQGQGKGKSGFSLPDIIKKQQDAISQMQQGMKQGKKEGKDKNGDKGKNGQKQGKDKNGNTGKEGESARQYELYKQQQRIKEDLEQLGDKFSDKATRQKIKELTKQMDELQKRLLREGITQSTLNKMIQLQHELLKLKNATFTQHQDDKRQSRTNYNRYKGIDSLFFKNSFKFEPKDEQLKRSQIPVNQKVKKKIHEYSN